MWPFLTYAMDRALIAHGKTRADFERALSVKKGVGTRMLDGDSAYPRDGIDAVVAACAGLVDTTPMELYREALDLWASDPHGRGLATRRRALATRRRGQRRARQRQGA